MCLYIHMIDTARGAEHLDHLADMPPKRGKATAGTAPKRRKAAKEDWRTPVFYWRGRVDGSKWSGTWVASTNGLPSDAEFEESANTFELTSSKSLATLHNWQLNSPDNPGGGGGASFTGKYKLDNGDGLADYSDVEHQIWAYNGPPAEHPSLESWGAVGACGDTEFGRFVSLGRLDSAVAGSHPQVYTRLTLARRYIAEDDPRKSMTCKDVVQRVVGPRAPDQFALQAPWLALPWKVPDEWPDALPVREDVYALLEANCEEKGTNWCVGVAPVRGP